MAKGMCLDCGEMPGTPVESIGGDLLCDECHGKFQIWVENLIKPLHEDYLRDQVTGPVAQPFIADDPKIKEIYVGVIAQNMKHTYVHFTNNAIACSCGWLTGGPGRGLPSAPNLRKNNEN